MPSPDERLQRYLSAYPWHVEFSERWPIQGQMRVRLSLAGELPPAHVSSSILSIVLDAARNVLFLDPANASGNISHLLIGGRSEGDETPEQTAIREVGEETGWRIEPVRMIGFRHFFQLEPRSDKMDRPYPDFIQPIFAVKAIRFDPDLILPADHIPAEMLDFTSAERMIDFAQRPLLHAAMHAMENGQA